MSGDDEQRLSFGGVVDGSVDAHLAAYLERAPLELAGVPVTLEPGGPVIGSVDEVRQTPTALEVTARVKGWVADALGITLQPWQVSLAENVVAGPAQLELYDGPSTIRRSATITGRAFVRPVRVRAPFVTFVGCTFGPPPARSWLAQQSVARAAYRAKTRRRNRRRTR